MFDLRTITIISGGQTGADRAALDFAIQHGIPHAGWCPRGRLAEDGPIEARYELRQTPSRRYAQRTQWNVRDSDATVVFSIAAELSGGSALTIELAERLGKPSLHLAGETTVGETTSAVGERRVSAATVRVAAEKLLGFLAEHNVRCLNIAGPRASQEPEIAAFVHAGLKATLDSTTAQSRRHWNRG